MNGNTWGGSWGASWGDAWGGSWNLGEDFEVVGGASVGVRGEPYTDRSRTYPGRADRVGPSKSGLDRLLEKQRAIDADRAEVARAIAASGVLLASSAAISAAAKRESVVEAVASLVTVSAGQTVEGVVLDVASARKINNRRRAIILATLYYHS